MSAWFRNLTMRLSGLIVAVWVGIAFGWRQVPESAEGALIGAGVGATVSVAVFLITRAQNKRQTTLELFKEYYSSEFGALRRRAEAFMSKYHAVNWHETDPYDIGRNDEGLSGYGAVLRYWQRVAILFREGEIDGDLIQRLLARELAHWQVLIFEPVFVRRNIYVKDLIGPFVHVVANGSEREAFKAGLRDGEHMKRKNTRALQVAKTADAVDPGPIEVGAQKTNSN